MWGLNFKSRKVGGSTAETDCYIDIFSLESIRANTIMVDFIETT